MPQLAIETFFAQFVWTLISLFGYYLVTVMYLMPRVSVITKVRE